VRRAGFAQAGAYERPGCAEIASGEPIEGDPPNAAASLERHIAQIIGRQGELENAQVGCYRQQIEYASAQVGRASA
jgi:hypothetical protein